MNPRIHCHSLIDVVSRVMWISNSSLFAPKVIYGLSVSKLTLDATGTTNTYVASQLCGAPANTSGFVNFCQLCIHTLKLAD